MDAAPVQHIEVIDGTAYLVGRRLKPKLIGAFYANGSMTIEQIMEEWNLARAEVHAAVTYYYDHQEEIEQTHQERIDEALRNGMMTAEEHQAQIRARMKDKESP